MASVLGRQAGDHKDEERKPTFQDLWVVSQAAAYLTNQACTISARNINDGVVRLQFNREVAYYARSIVRDVEEGRKTIDQGLREIKQEQESLINQSLEVGRKGIGVIAGALQFATEREFATPQSVRCVCWRAFRSWHTALITCTKMVGI